MYNKAVIVALIDPTSRLHCKVTHTTRQQTVLERISNTTMRPLGDVMRLCLINYIHTHCLLGLVCVWLCLL